MKKKPEMRRFCIWLPENLMKKIKRLAEETNLASSIIIRMAIQKFIEEE